jgi:hypothetical protein
MKDVNKAFRTISLCTHPDRLRGRLKREATAAEERRGEIMFKRASDAKDDLANVLKGRQKKVACYQGELELALIGFFAQVGVAASGLGIGDYATFCMDIFWRIVTFEEGFFQTIMTLLWLLFLLRIVKQFFVYLWRMGIMRMVLAPVTTMIIGPIPTVLHFIFLPFIRFFVFFRSDLLRHIRPMLVRSTDADGGEGAEDVNGTDKKTDAEPEKPITAAMKAAAARTQELPNRGIRQRKKKETDEERKQKNEDLLAGGRAQSQISTSDPDAVVEAERPGDPMPEGVWNCVTWRVGEPVKARQNAADAVQFDLLLILTKPIIPLIMLISLGQVWNGIFSSLFIGHALRRWVPQMSYEAHHLLCAFFGSVHTLLGVSATQVEEFANRDEMKVLALAWNWSFKDVLCVMHMCLLGSTVTAMASLGNEPSFAASFASGIALRIALAQDSIRSRGLFQLAAQKFEGALRDLGISLANTEEVVAYSGDGIGDCAGGPFRMLFGDGAGALWAARILKACLMIMPLMATGQWLLRTVRAGGMLGKRSKKTRFVQRVILFVLGLLQCLLLANTELNASNGALGNFWIAMLFGCIGESLMCTYDVRGLVRQILFLVIFLLM